MAAGFEPSAGDHRQHVVDEMRVDLRLQRIEAGLHLQ
jgi:hypothetical protein